jgi:hypothetical protein
MNSPCYDCCQGYIGCHDGCPEFKKYRLHKEMVSEKMNEEREFDRYLSDAIANMKGTGRGLR